MTELTRVFVYGTLMPGERNEHVARAVTRPHCERATLRGYALWDLQPEGYPGLVPGEDHEVIHGWACTYPPETWPEVLAHLDELEDTHATPPLYERRQVSVHTQGETRLAWVYVYARPERLAQPGARRVTGGRWAGYGRTHPAVDTSRVKS